MLDSVIQYLSSKYLRFVIVVKSSQYTDYRRRTDKSEKMFKFFRGL